MNQIEEKQMENKIRYFCSLLTSKRGFRIHAEKEFTIAFSRYVSYEKVSNDHVKLVIFIFSILVDSAL